MCERRQVPASRPRATPPTPSGSRWPRDFSQAAPVGRAIAARRSGLGAKPAGVDACTGAQGRSTILGQENQGGDNDGQMVRDRRNGRLGAPCRRFDAGRRSGERRHEGGGSRQAVRWHHHQHRGGSGPDGDARHQHHRPGVGGAHRHQGAGERGAVRRTVPQGDAGASGRHRRLRHAHDRAVLGRRHGPRRRARAARPVHREVRRQERIRRYRPGIP